MSIKYLAVKHTQNSKGLYNILVLRKCGKWHTKYKDVYFKDLEFYYQKIKCEKKK